MPSATRAEPLPAPPIAQAEAVLARRPSVALGAALQQAEKVEAGPITYTAGNGEVVKLRPDSIRATAEMAAEARHRLAAVEAVLAARVDPVDLGIWLYKLAEIVEKPPVGDAMDLAVKALTTNLDLPACCFTDESRRAAARFCVWWPGLAKLEKALEPFVAPLEAERRRLEAVIGAVAAATVLPAPSTPASGHHSRTAEEIAAVRAKAHAFQAEMAGKVDAEGKPALKVQPRYLLDEHLIEQYRWIVREGGPFATAAQTRLNALLRGNGTLSQGNGKTVPNERDSR